MFTNFEIENFAAYCLCPKKRNFHRPYQPQFYQGWEGGAGA